MFEVSATILANCLEKLKSLSTCHIKDVVTIENRHCFMIDLTVGL